MSPYLQESFERQGQFFRTGSTLPLTTRLDSLRALQAALRNRSDDALDALSADLGKPPLEAWLSELHFVLSEIKNCLRSLPRWARAKRAKTPFYFLPARSEVRREPLGRTLIAGPWNYPIQLTLSPLVSSIAAGNCCLLKPSELAPATSALLAEIISEAFDPDHVMVIEGDGTVGASLLELPFDLFFFTGGEQIGRLYAQAAAAHLSPAILELGGKCPAILDRNLNLGEAVQRLISAKFFNAGQTCVAPDFILIPDALHNDFVEQAHRELNARYGPGLSADLARIINDHHFQRLKKLIPDDAIAVGSDDPIQRYLAPRILPDARWDMPAMQEEIFGPILPVIRYRNLDEALARLQERPTPLALSTFSSRREFHARIAKAVASGSLCLNDALKPASNYHLPLGGIGASGMGRYHGEAGFQSFSYQRSVTKRWQHRDIFRIKPPYGDRLQKLRRLLGE